MRRKKVFDTIEAAREMRGPSAVYDIFMMVVIVISLVPLAFRSAGPVITFMDYFSVTVFVIDYLLRLLTADLKLKKGWVSFLLYPFTFLALVDLASILPTFLGMATGLRVLKVIRLVRTFRVFRSMKFFRYSKSVRIIYHVILDQKGPLLTVCTVAAAYVIISAMVLFSVEPDTFTDFFEALYWATISLTTIGYGDICPVSTIGRLISMVSAFLGIAIIALPSSIITAGYLERLHGGGDEGARETRTVPDTEERDL